MGGLVSGEAIAALGYVAVTEPSGGGGVVGEGGDHPWIIQASPCEALPGLTWYN